MRILFQPNSGGLGTVELWSRTYGPGATTEVMRGQVVSIPNLPVPGRLTIEVTVHAAFIEFGHPDLAHYLTSTLDVRLDHLRLD